MVYLIFLRIKLVMDKEQKNNCKILNNEGILVKMKTLANLRKGQSGIIFSVNIQNEQRKNHLLDMGLTPGTKIKVKKIAPMDDPISIELRRI